jgi:TonB family protein
MRLAACAVCLLALPSVLSGQSCPDVDPAAGYPVSAVSDGPVNLEWLTVVARSAAYRWKVPSRRRNLYAGWERVQRRTLPPEPRWADDWTSKADHQAIATLVLFRNAERNRLELTETSGDKTFDESLRSIVNDPMPASADFPALPKDAADSVVIGMVFGAVPSGERVALVRFAAHQTRIELDRASLRIDPPAGHRGDFPIMTVKYDVTESGRVNPASIEFVRSTGGRAYENAVRDGLVRARFTPPTSNCRPVSQTVVQTFGR